MRDTPLLFLCAGEDGLTEQLQRPLRGMNRIEQPGQADMFMLPHGELFRLLHETGFDVENHVELYAPEDAERHEYYSFTSPDWARQRPVQEIWAARKLR